MNFLLITSDQQHWMAMGYNNPEIKTPNLDRLAARGVVFDRAYCPNPTCTPTRASILTGQYPSQHGAYSLGTGLDPAKTTINDVLHKAGYRTGLVGKAHFQPLANTPEYPSLESYPLMQDLDFWRSHKEPFFGFDDFELARNHADEGHVGQHYAIWMEEQGFTNWRESFVGPGGTGKSHQYGRWNIPEKFHYNTWIAERTNALISQYAADEQPFFLWSSYLDPHPPYLVPEPWDTMYDPASLTLPVGQEGEHEGNPRYHRYAMDSEGQREDYGITGRWLHGVQHHRMSEEKLRRNLAIYYGMISCMDSYIGKTLDHLDALGLTDKTLIAFTSDHGHYTGQHGLNFKGPFHYEYGIRVPLIVSMPGTVPQGVVSPALQSLVDIPVTFLAAGGIPIFPAMSGVDQWAVWQGIAPSARDCCIVENNMDPGCVELKTYVDERYKLTVYRPFDEGEMYDLQEDPEEFHNLFHDHKHVELRARLLQKFLQAEMAKESRPMARTGVA